MTDSAKLVKGPFPSPLIQQALVEAKAIIDANATLVDSINTLATNCKTLVNDIRAKLVGSGLLSVPTLGIGSTPTGVATLAFDFVIAGKVYKKAAVAAGTALSGSTVPQNKYGAFRLQIGADGTIDLVAATGNATGYDSAALALAGLPAVASNHVAIGTITVMSTDPGGFIPGTTELSAAHVTEAYADAQCIFEQIGAAVP